MGIIIAFVGGIVYKTHMSVINAFLSAKAANLVKGLAFNFLKG